MVQGKILLIIVLIIVFVCGTVIASYSLTMKSGEFQKEIEKITIEKSKLKIIYTETTDEVTTIWIASVNNLMDKRALTTITHKTGYSINARLSPDGSKIAYTLLPQGGNRFSDGELWIIAIDGGKRRVDQDLYYLEPPVWSPAGTTVVYMKKTQSLGRWGYKIELYSTNIEGTKRELLLADNTALGIHPIGWSPDGRLFYYDRILPTGDDLWSVDTESGNTLRFITHISEDAAYNLNLSPDGKYILGSILENRKWVSYSIILVSTDGKEKEILERGAKKHYTPIWTSEGSKITYNSSEAKGYISELKTLDKYDRSKSMINVSQEGFDIPISWSPNDKWLALEYHYDSLIYFYIMKADDTRRQMIPPSNWVHFVGWMTEED